MFDVTNCAVTLDMIIVVLGILGICFVWSRFKLAFFIVYFFSVFWLYTLNQKPLMEMIGQDAFYWSSAAALGFGALLWTITLLLPGRH
ncbi:MAG: hypothetical protein GWM98_07215 [Nitrospinaceae bacterium]|nr:hypothetical protein [Nitrospinaceae bacterium]NIR54326.1 hypothetical protein [Nitrospinaceae bacterium]NIS84744.1 hypothetical protein [Nitrospinaceae bacterium]NIT81545.1 hypothetical protein [Nitrospinaceae bacterium]NIU43830.1 hypothetical protein [Nitrospinaceae bacterium]